MELNIKQNIINGAITQYASFPFNRGIVTVAGNKYGLSGTKLCKCGGNTDDGAPISAYFETVPTSYKEGVKKLRSIYLNGQFETADSMSIEYIHDSYTDTMNRARRSVTAKVGNGGIGKIKYQCSRTGYGETIMLRVGNESGQNFFINRITGHIIVRNSI